MQKFLVNQTIKLILTAIAMSVSVQAMSADAVIVKTAPRSNMQIAIVPFAGAENMSAIVNNDLTQLGQFSSSANLPERPYSSGEVNLPLWQHQGVPYLVVGSTRTNNGMVDINFEVINVATGQIMQGLQTVKTKNTPQLLRMAGHKVADRIYEILTGIKGDFSGKIAFVVETGSGKNKVSRLVISDVDGYNPRIVTTVNGSIKALNPAIHGRSFTYVSQQNNGLPVVYSMDVASGQANLLTPYKAHNYGASISPDGSQILFSSSRDGNPEIYLMSAYGGTPQRLTNHPMADMYPSWSPDGRSFIFTSDRNGNNRPQIYRYTFGSNSIQQITHNGGQNLIGRYSNDGKKMSYLAGNNQGSVMDLTTGAVTPINNVGLSEAPSISPNGQHYIYSNRNMISIVSNGKIVNISPQQNGVPSGTIYGPIWLKPQ